MTYYQEHQSDFLEGLKTILRIPSISTLSEHKPDIRRAAEFAVNELRAAGMTVAETIEGEGNPLVYAEWLGAPGKPTLLFYGHYDVQPVDPLNLWETPPFEATIRDGEIYARGSADDKGQVFMHLKAVEALKSDDGTKVVAKMKEMPTDDPLFGKGTIRVDGRKIHPAYLVEVKTPSESKAPWDYYKVRATIPADQAFRPLKDGGCSLVK